MAGCNPNGATSPNDAEHRSGIPSNSDLPTTAIGRGGQIRTSWREGCARVPGPFPPSRAGATGRAETGHLQPPLSRPPILAVALSRRPGSVLLDGHVPLLDRAHGAGLA
jgi:hypothetical protein